MVPQESVSSWLMDSIVLSERQSHKKHQFNDTSFVLWEVRNYHIIIYSIVNCCGEYKIYQFFRRLVVEVIFGKNTLIMYIK